MKKQFAKMIAKIAEKNIKVANNTTCLGFSYQPKAPQNIKNFAKTK